MSETSRLIKRYKKDDKFRYIVDQFYMTIRNSDDMKLKDFIKAVRLAEYKNDLYQLGEGRG